MSIWQGVVAGVYNGIGSTQRVFIVLKKCPNAVIMCLYVNARMCAFIWPWVCLCVCTGFATEAWVCVCQHKAKWFPCLVRLHILGHSKHFPLFFSLRCTESIWRDKCSLCVRRQEVLVPLCLLFPQVCLKCYHVLL